jgi:hypothetical protein
MRYFPLLLAAAIACAPVIAHATPQDDIYKAIQADIRNKKYDDATLKAQQTLEDKTLSPADKARFLSIAADAALRQTPAQSEQAKKYYDQIVADDTIANSAKISTYENLANLYIASLSGQYIDKVDVSPANEIMARALALPNLTPTEQAATYSAIGKLYARQARYEDALVAYQKVIALEINDGLKARAWRAMADVEEQRGNGDAALALYRQHNLGNRELYQALKRLGRTDEMVAEISKVLDDPATSDKERWAAFQQLSLTRALVDKYLPKFLETDPNRATILLPSFKLTEVFRNNFYKRFGADEAYLAWAAPILLKAPKLSDKDYAYVTIKYVNALAGLGQGKLVTTAVAAAQQDARLGVADKFWAQLVGVALAGKAADAVKTVQAEKSLPDKEKAQAVLNAAQTVLQAEHNEAARALFAAYESLFVRRPQAQIACAFVENAPFDVGSWLTSPLLKNKNGSAKMDRPYGDNLEFLILTDSSTTGRNTDVASKEVTPDTDSNLHIVSDVRGIHMYFDLRDSQAKEVLDGIARGGSIEMYLAPGQGQAYYCFLPRLPEGQIETGPGSFITMYPNSGWRLPSTQEGTLKSDMHRTENGFGMSLFLSWELFYDKLPKNGDKWQLEAIRWTRSGGFSFGGSESVHNRSSWGDIVFSGLTRENLNEIKRAIVFQAVNKYRSAKKINALAGQWEDSELGDSAFFEAKVKPLFARLDGYAAQVNKEMTAADVETLFKEAVPDWMELNFRVAALRAQYLKNKQLGTS